MNGPVSTTQLCATWKLQLLAWDKWFSRSSSRLPFPTFRTVNRELSFSLGAGVGCGPSPADKLSPICIFPADGARTFLPLRNVHYVSPAIIPDDYTDVALVEVNQSALGFRRHGRARFLDLGIQVPDWRQYQNITDFVVIGFPSNRSYVDYDDCRIHSERVALYGRYVGPAKSAHIFTLEIGDPKGLESFNGFSGGPVFSWVRRVGHKPTLTLAGMVIQGTVESQLMHFIEASIIFNAADVWPAAVAATPGPSLQSRTPREG